MRQKTCGLIAAPFTPMRANGELNLDIISLYAQFLRKQGVIGVFVNGTTGEGQSLTIEERKATAEVWLKAGKGLKIFVHVGHACLADAQDLAQHAQRIGVDAIAMCAPYFFKPSTPSALATALAPVAAAAPSLPFYYYHIPCMTGVAVSVHDLFAAAANIPNLAGAKFTYEDLLDFQLCMAAQGGRFDMLFGRDEMLLASLALGAQGAVGTTYNFAAPLYRDIIAAFRAGDWTPARQKQCQAAQMIRFVQTSGIHVLSAFKVMMKMVGIDCGPLRPPLPPVSAAQERTLKIGLESLGFFTYASVNNRSDDTASKDT